MALNVHQRAICQLLAQNRVRSGESYLAGGATLNELLCAPRLSRDIDVFHDTKRPSRCPGRRTGTASRRQGKQSASSGSGPGLSKPRFRAVAGPS